MDVTTLKYGVACLAVLGFTFWGRRATPHALPCALMISGTFIATNLVNANIPYPHCFKLYAPINLLCGALTSYYLHKRPQVWTLTLALSFLAQIGLELRFALHGGYSDYGLVADFMASENSVFNLQLAILCMPGGLGVLGLLVRRLLPDPIWYRLERAALWPIRQAKEG